MYLFNSHRLQSPLVSYKFVLKLLQAKYTLRKTRYFTETTNMILLSFLETHNSFEKKKNHEDETRAPAPPPLLYTPLAYRNCGFMFYVSILAWL